MTTTENKKNGNAVQLAAKAVKDDEFYTPLNVVADELDHYYSQLYGKTIYCPCDDPRWSNFVKYFINNRDKLNNTVYASCYYKADGVNLTQVTVIAAKRGNPAGVLDRPDYRRPRTETEKAVKEIMKKNGIDIGRDTQITILEKVDQLKDGVQPLFSQIGLGESSFKTNFEKTETFDLLFSVADVIVTNPPFSGGRFQFLIEEAIKRNKKFLIMGNFQAASYKWMFKFFKNGQVKTGFGENYGVEFTRPDGSSKVVGVTWYTNLDKHIDDSKTKPVGAHKYTVADLKERGLWNVYDCRPDVLFLTKAADVPIDYTGLMAVPFTDPSRYLNGAFELVEPFCDGQYSHVNGERKNARFVIRRKQNTAHDRAANLNQKHT